MSTRFKSSTSKLLHPVAGRPLFAYTLDAVREVKPDRIVVVYGKMTEGLRERFPELEYVRQPEPLGTAHAVLVAVEALGEEAVDYLVLSADVPLLTAETLSRFIAAYRERSFPLAMLIARLSDPTGYGRVILQGSVIRRVVEEKDAGPEEKAIPFVNVGIYLMAGEGLAEDLRRIGKENVAGEYYLPDLVEIRPSFAVELRDPLEMQGVNTRQDLARVEGEVQRRLREALMVGGVTLEDPEAVYLDYGVRVENDVVLRPGTILRGETTVGQGSVIGPFSELIDTKVGRNCTVVMSQLEGAVLEDGVRVGPFAHLRPGSLLRQGAKVGNFVEVKKSVLGPGVKANHLAYLGDAEVGEGTNVGAGTITCNYDGFMKHRTVIGRHAFIGSDTILVAPVKVGDGAITGAGSVITQDVPPGALGIERSKQKNVEGFAEEYRKKKQREKEERQGKAMGSGAEKGSGEAP